MSTTVDNRVVELEFDNKHFESNVKTTMSTLEKLKQSLNLKGASKGLEDVQTAASKCNLSGLTQGISEAQNRFSALQVVGVTALATLTNQAVNAGQRIVKSLTIGSAQDGFREYETQMNAIQTILANTQKEGTNVAIVNKYLDELNEYADKTIYNFTEMTRNIGTFTAAGVKLDTSVTSIKGIANLAAISGSTSQQASTAMYQLSQAIASGTVKLMDWNSVVNAGMGGQVFQDALLRTSELLQTGGKAAVEAKGSFRESLSEGWLTVDVLTQTLDMFATAAETEAEYAAAVEKFVSQGYTQQQAEEMATMAKTAGEAATKVKTFTQLIDTCKEAMGSGWAQTWRLIFGDFEQARTLWSSVSDVLSGLINSFSEARNSLLESALGKSFVGLSEKITGVLEPALDMADTVSDVTSAVADMGAVVDDVLVGVFGNGQERFDALTESGFNYYRIQNEVNKKLGDSHRYTEAQIAAQDKLLGTQTETASAIEDTATETKKLTDAQKKQIKQLAKMSDEQLRAKGYTEEQIEALNELRDTAKKLSIPFDEFIDKLDEINGRWFLIRSFENIGTAISKVFKAMSDAVSSVFDPIQPDQIFNLITGFHNLTASLIPSEETLDKLTRTFKGLFAAIDLVTTILGGGFKVAFEVLSGLLGVTGKSVLDFTAFVGDMVYKFNEWFQNSVFGEFVEGIVEGIQEIIESVREFVDQFKIDEKLAAGWASVAEGMSSLWTIVKAKLPKVAWPTLINNVLKLFGTTTGDALIAISDFIVKIFDWLDANTLLVKGTTKIAEIVAKLIEGIAGLYESFMALEPVQKFIENIADAFERFFSKFGGVEIGTGAFDTLLSTIEKVFDNINKWLETLGDSEHFGQDLVTGLINGIISGIGMVVSAVSSLATSVIEAVCSVLGIHSPSTVMFGIGQNVILGLINGIKSFSVLGALFTLLTGIGSGIAAVFDGKKDSLFDAGAKFFEGFYNGILSVWNNIKSFLWGVGHGIGDVFEKIDWGVVTTIAGAIAVFIMFSRLLKIFDKFGDAAKALTSPFKKLSDVFGALADGIKDNMKAKALKTKADAIKSLATALAIIVGAVVALSLCDTEKAWEGVKMVGVLAGIFAVLAAVLVGLNVVLTKFGTFGDGSLKNIVNIASLAGVLVSLSVLLLAFAATIKILASVDGSAMQSALVAIGVFGAILLAFTALSGFKPPDTTGMAKTMIGMAALFLIMAVVLKTLGSLTGNEIKLGLTCIVTLSAVIIALMALTQLIAEGRNLNDAGSMLLKVAAAMGIMALTAKLIGSMTWADMGKAALGITYLGGIIVGLMAATRLVNNQRGLGDIGLTLLGIAAAIGILALVVKLIATTPFEQMKKGIQGIALLGVVMMLLVKATSFTGGKDLKGVAATLFGMSLCIGILAGACVILGLVDPDTVRNGVIAVGALASVIALLTWATKHAGAADLKGTMIGMAIAIGVLAASIAILSFIDPKKLIGPTIAMMVLLGFFALVELASKEVSKSLGSIIVLTVAIGLIAAALWLLSSIPAEQLIPTAAALAIAMSGFAVALLALGKVGTVSKSALIGVAAMAGVVAILAVVLGVLSALNLEVSIETALSLSVLLLALSGSVAILSVVGAAATAAIPGIAVVAGMIVALGAILIAIGALMEYVPEAEEFLNKGVSVLETLGQAIGSFFGGIIGGFAEGVTSTLPDIADNLSDFMTRLEPFIAGLKMVDDSSVSAAKSLADVILTLTAAGIVDAMTSWLTGGKSLDSFADQLNSFGEGMKTYATAVEGINTEAIVSSVTAAEGIVGVLNALPKDGGIFQAFSGRKDLASFGNTLVMFGRGMKSYATSVEGINTEAITNSVKAAEGIVDIVNALPKEGGVFQAFTGNKNLASFGNNLVPFGEGMKAYGKSVVGVDSEAIIKSADAAESLVKVAEAIPSEGGVWQWLAGEKDLGAFATNLIPFGEGMKKFGSAVTGLNTDAIVDSVKAAEAIVEVEEAVPVANVLPRDYTITSQLVPFGKGIQQYAASVAGIDVGAVKDSVTAGKELCDLVDRAAGMDTGGASSLVSAMNELATVSFDGIIKAFGQAPAALESVGSSFVTGLASGMTNTKSTAVDAATTIVNAVKDAISDKADQFTLAGKTLVGMLASGITKSTSVAADAARAMASDAASAISLSTMSFYSAGAACAQGFANGIAFNSFLATTKARAMANAAVLAAKEALNINSPSRVFMAIGQGVPEGFAKGIDKYGYYVNDSIEMMASSALDNTKSVISRIGDALSNTDMDSQPTIRPVVDLSGVESGAAAINGMFGNDFALGAKMNLNAISTSMNRRNQNGVNDDVVSAINKLRKDVGAMERPSYNVGGITYDEGSAVANAVAQLVHAVRVERRV